MMKVPQLCVVGGLLYLFVAPTGGMSGVAEIGEKGKCIGVCDRKIDWGADVVRVQLVISIAGRFVF